MFQESKPASVAAARNLAVRHRSVSTTEVRQDSWLGRLDPEAHARDATFAVRAQPLDARVFGVALDGHLGVGASRDGVQDRQQHFSGQARGRPTAEEDRRRHGESAVGCAGDLARDGSHVARHQVVAVGVGRERAVVAALGAEGHVDVHAEVAGLRFQGRHPSRSARRRKWRRPNAARAAVCRSEPRSPLGRVAITSPAPDGSLSRSTEARSPLDERRTRPSASGEMATSLATLVAQRATDFGVEGDEGCFSPAVDASVDDRSGSIESEQPQVERGRHQFRS